MLFLPVIRYPGMSSVENHPETTTKNPCSPNVNDESSVFLLTRHFAAEATAHMQIWCSCDLLCSPTCCHQLQIIKGIVSVLEVSARVLLSLQ